MWCADCQQDVPAVARSTREPLICSRCHHELAPYTATVPSDTGIALDSYDQALASDSGSVSEMADSTLSPPRDWFEQDQTRQRLREIDRMLHSPYRRVSANPVIPRSQRAGPEWPVAEVEPLRSVARRAAAEPTSGWARRQTAWLLSGLLSLGVIAFCAGIGLLTWSAALQLPQLWQQGMTLTIGAEGLLILSLTWMAARLWRNSRRVNHQLHGVDRQLAEIEQLAGSLAGGQLASSQHYYHHFSQVASPHLLVANLQGQIDQLAARVATG